MDVAVQNFTETLSSVDRRIQVFSTYRLKISLLSFNKDILNKQLKNKLKSEKHSKLLLRYIDFHFFNFNLKNPQKKKLQK